jgi:hypothetical protein
VVKANWSDGAALTVAIGPRGGSGITRIASALLDLADDRSFLSEAHRDLVEMVPNLSVHPEQPPDQGWIRVGTSGGFSELHVLLRPLPPGIDLMLGQCAMELLAAAGDGTAE